MSRTLREVFANDPGPPEERAAFDRWMRGETMSTLRPLDCCGSMSGHTHDCWAVSDRARKAPDHAPGDPCRACDKPKVTPITAWPPRKFSGKPGYSAGHFAALAGGDDDPLRVAARIADRAITETIGREMGAMLERGDDLGQVLDWHSRELTAAKARRWAELCASFDEVINVLASVEQTPMMRRLIREAKAASKRAA